MGKFLGIGLLVAIGFMFVRELPSLKRYMKIERM